MNMQRDPSDVSMSMEIASFLKKDVKHFKPLLWRTTVILAIQLCILDGQCPLQQIRCSVCCGSDKNLMSIKQLSDEQKGKSWQSSVRLSGIYNCSRNVSVLVKARKVAKNAEVRNIFMKSALKIEKCFIVLGSNNRCDMKVSTLSRL